MEIFSVAFLTLYFQCIRRKTEFRNQNLTDFEKVSFSGVAALVAKNPRGTSISLFTNKSHSYSEVKRLKSFSPTV